MKYKRKAKDSVFTNLFGRKEYALQLFKVLHPEENQATENDIEIITIENVFTDGVYNDLGLMFKNKLILLVEAQSTWNGNMAARSLLYLSETYKRYLDKNKITLFTSATVELPVPEVYVIYSGKKANYPDEISLNEHFPLNMNSPLQLKVKMIYDSKEGDIIYQYINFCKVFDEMREKYPDSIVLAVKETFRICLDKSLLSEFLKEHETELNDIMYDFLYNEEYWRKLMLRDERKKAREEGLAEGREEGLAEGRAVGMEQGKAEGRAEGRAESKLQDAVLSVIKLNVSPEKAAEVFGVSIDDIKSEMSKETTV